MIDETLLEHGKLLGRAAPRLVIARTDAALESSSPQPHLGLVIIFTTA
jgi:hypothetical protein